MDEEVKELYQYFATTEENLVKQNIKLLTWLENKLSNDELEVVKEFKEHTEFENLHASLQKSTLIMVENIKL